MQVRIHSKIILDHPHSAALYYLIRSYDRKGSGWARVSIKITAKLLGISQAAVMKRVVRLKELGFIYECQRQNDRLWMKYVGIDRLKERTTGVFASTRIQTKVLTSIVELKKAAYQAAIARQQEACRRAISKKNTKAIFEPKQNKDGSAYATGCIFISKAKRFFVKLGRACIGASQLTLAEGLHKSRSTVGKWCRKFESIQVWVRQRLQENPLPDVYECYRIVYKKGRPVKVRQQYKRMPNYYFLDSPEAKSERADKSKVVKTAAREENERRLEATDRRVRCAAIVNQKRRAPRYKSLAEKLCDKYTRKKIDSIAWAYMKIFLGKEVELERVAKLDLGILVENIDQIYSKLNDWQRDMADIVLKRVANNKSAVPPIYNCCGGQQLEYLIDPSQFNRTTGT